MRLHSNINEYMYLTEDKMSCKRQVYGRAGDRVRVIEVRYHVALVSLVGQDDGFPTNVNTLSEYPIEIKKEKKRKLPKKGDNYNDTIPIKKTSNGRQLSLF